MRAKKSLGQHFLKSQTIIEKIVRTANLRSSDIVLEVGPGKGMLTAALLTKVAEVVAVEKSDELAEYLKKRFAAEIEKKKLVLVHADILDFNPYSYGLSPGTYKIVANIPYYITGLFLRRFLSSAAYPESMTLLVQKEVAERIVAKDKKESLYSVGVKAYGMPRYVDTVRAGSFSPAPTVDSAILSIDNISRSQFHDIDEKTFFEIVHAGFAHKRKQLATNLVLAYGKSFSPQETFSPCGIPLNARAEDMSIPQWKCLVKFVVQNKS